MDTKPYKTECESPLDMEPGVNEKQQVTAELNMSSYNTCLAWLGTWKELEGCLKVGSLGHRDRSIRKRPRGWKEFAY